MRKVFVSIFALNLFALSPALATSFVAIDNISNSTLISAGDVVSGKFDINYLLENDSGFLMQYDITSAYIKLNFSDYDQVIDYQYPTSAYSVYNTYHSPYFNNYSYYLERDGSMKYSYEYEEVVVDVGDSTETYSTNYNHSEYTSRWYDGSLKDSNNNNYYYYTDYNVIHEGYWGSLSETFQLSDSALLDLALDGILDFTVSGAVGDISLQSASLYFDIEPNPAPVPEPATFILLGSGLAALAFYRRRR
ncbi:VPLPA-CTERM protein sorting domain-containing protein [Malonomonas rubra DSM 5091]|uniref:VPLPA-CTERM protein sorting domain-containing protein n=1 Tax=Malonomonas rubra DSM 5091 TaxID=1122189 RepID=A0A1M6E052_MALRU|nr:PEP-CTERM sorting domain-containing protein [Malonomonas rubra]SHI78892.1 VPLPA-CTERM protein sorting domain-containing protein [Malonomonas rubra DSM 5091]